MNEKPERVWFDKCIWSQSTSPVSIWSLSLCWSVKDTELWCGHVVLNWYSAPSLRVIIQRCSFKWLVDPPPTSRSAVPPPFNVTPYILFSNYLSYWAQLKFQSCRVCLIQMLQLSDWAHKHTSCTFQTEHHPFALDVLTLSHGLSTTPPTQVWHGKFVGDVGWIIWLGGAAARWWVTGDLSVIDKAIQTLWVGRVSATWSWLATYVTFS